MEIPLTFLGTGQAIPTPKRNHSAIFFQYKDENILLDCGEGTQRQFRIADISPTKITRILISHWHGDHVLGLPGLFQTLALSNYNKTLYIYGPRRTKQFIEDIFRLFVFVQKLDVKIIEIESGKVFETPDFYIEAFPMSHGAPCLAYSFVEKDKIRIKKDKLSKLKLEGKLIGELARGKDIEANGKKIKAKDMTYTQEGKKITIIMDTKLNPNMIKIAKDSDLLICESTYSADEEELAKEYNHLTSVQAAETAKKSDSKKLILTHLSQRYEHNERAILEPAKKIFKNVSIAHDFEKVII